MAKINNDTFKELNGPVQLYMGKINHWVIVLKRADLVHDLKTHGETAVLDIADDLANEWWRRVIGAQDVADFRATGVFPAVGLPSGKRLQMVQPWPIEFDQDDYVYVAFEFEPRGKTELPWPWEIGVFGSWDEPLSGLIATFAPHQVIDIPGPLEALEQTWTDVQTDAASAGGAIASGLKTAVVWIGAGALALWFWGKR